MKVFTVVSSEQNLWDYSSVASEETLQENGVTDAKQTN